MSTKHIGKCCCGSAGPCFQEIQILGCAGQPLAGRVVRLMPGGTLATADEDGIVILPFPGPGTYTVTLADMPGFVGAAITIATCTPDPITIEFEVNTETHVCAMPCCPGYYAPKTLTFTDPQGAVPLLWRASEGWWRSETVTRETCDGLIFNHDPSQGTTTWSSTNPAGPWRSGGFWPNFTHEGVFPCYFAGSPCGGIQIFHSAIHRAGDAWPFITDNPDFHNPITPPTFPHYQKRVLLRGDVTGYPYWTESANSCHPVLRAQTTGAGNLWNTCQYWDRFTGITYGDPFETWVYGPGPHNYTLTGSG